MLYVQMKERLYVQPGETLRVMDVADVLGDQAEQAKKLHMDVDLSEGIWRIPATALVQALLPLGQEVSVLGADEIFIHVSRKKRDASHPIRAALAFCILFFGSALAIAWFHADVGMEDAQQQFVRMLTGRETEHPLMMAAPYALGVALGVGGYYALLPGKKTVSPLDIKLGEYRSKEEKTAGRIP